MKKLTKLPLLLAVPLLAAGALTSCATGGGDQIVAWTFSTELKEIADNYYTRETGKKVKVVIKSTVTQVQNDLDNALRSGKNIPDIIALEAAVIADFTSKNSAESNLVPLDDIEGTDDMYQYTKDVATSTDGKLLGLSWQATPGGFFYKKSIAAKLGINSVEEMEAAISSWDNYLALAKRCHEYSDNDIESIAICSSITDPVKVFLSERSNSWVKDNTLQMEDVMFGPTTEGQNCLDVVRDLHQLGYTHEASDRGPMWITDINSNDTLGYFCSSWGLNFDLMPNARTSFGDWQMCRAPHDYFKGGTWLAIPQGSAKVEDAKDFIKYVTTDKTFLNQRGLDTGDFLNSKTVMQELAANYSCEFLGGQNHLAILYDVANNIDGKLISPYDATIDSAFTTVAATYAMEECLTSEEVEDARENAKDNFITSVRSKFPTINAPEQ